MLAGAAGHRIELVGVEVGFGAVLRRLGLHRLARRARADVVGWTDLHLTSERGHAVQLATPRSAVHLLAARELAVLLSRLDTESAAEVLRVKDPDFAADVVREIHPVVGERAPRALPSTDAAEIVAAMPAVHATQWRRRLAHLALRGRPFLRSHVWPGEAAPARGLTLGALLAVVGPGLLAGLSDDDPAGITTYSVLGASHGYQLLWVLLLSTVALVMFHGLGVRMGVVTGQGLIGLVRQRYGVRWGGAVLVGLVVANIGTTCAEFAGIAAGFELFGISRYLSVPVGGGASCHVLVLRGSFHRVEHLLLLLCTVFLAYIASGIIGRPRLGRRRARASWCRPCPAAVAAIAIVTATVGTTLAPWGLSFIQSYAVDKKLRTKDLALERVDVVIGAVLTGVIGFFVVVACAATLHREGRAHRRCGRRGRCPATAGGWRGCDPVRRRPHRRGPPGGVGAAALDRLLGV